ncbi:MAG: hypothetical protein GC208_09310 [Alphaproteobacteria bacterium]|nr:hypothetical protein [Alphaproteobacteria bacterium]
MPERFEILTAGFYLFVQAKRRPLAFVWLVFWSIVLFAALFGGIFLAIRPFEGLSPENGEVPPEDLVWFFAAILFALVGMLVFFLVFYTGWNRFLVGRKLPALIPFRLGLDEGRSFVVGLVHMALLMGVYLLMIIPFFVFMMLVSIPLSATGTEPGGWAMAGSAIAVLLFYGLYLFGLLAAGVKFAPAYAMTVLEKRIVIFDSWEATKGVFWSAFVSTLIPVGFSIIAQIALLLIQLIVQGVMMLAGFNPEPETVSASNGAVMVSFGVMIVIGGAIWICMMAMALGPYAYMAVWHDRNRQHREPQMAPLEPPASG